MTDEHYLGQVFASEPLDIDYGLKKSKNAQVPIWYFFKFFFIVFKILFSKFIFWTLCFMKGDQNGVAWSLSLREVLLMLTFFLSLLIPVDRVQYS